MDLQSPQAGTRKGTRHKCDHDRQAAEDKKEPIFGIILLAYHKSGVFIRIASPTFRHAFLHELQLNMKTDNLHDAGGYLVNMWSIFYVIHSRIALASRRKNIAKIMPTPEPDMTYRYSL
jgi:hypothetical protein